MSKAVSSELKTVYEPDLPWNRWKREPKAANKETKEPADPGEERPVAERIRVTIAWPTIEESARLSEAGGTQAIALAYAKRCIVGIENASVLKLDVSTGEELLAIRSKKQRKAWQLAINVGSYVFNQSFMDEDEEKN